MAETKNSNTTVNLFKKRIVNYFSKNGKLIGQIVLTLIFFVIGFWFIKNEQSELYQIKDSVTNAKPIWLLVGLLVTILYIFLQGLMYVASFSAIDAKITLKDATFLFLKRNFISVFIPAGGITSLLYFTEPFGG